MNPWIEELPLPDDFSGIVRLFPLPDTVVFPNVIQPLHIFEPRYCDMLQAAMDDDRLIAMATLKPDWEKSCAHQPPIEKVVCIGRVVSHSPTDDGRHNILLFGRHRARIIRELPMEHAFRQAEVELLVDQFGENEHEDISEISERLLKFIRKTVPNVLLAEMSGGSLAENPLPLGILSDILAYGMDLPVPIKLQLLSEVNVYRRVRLLLRCMEQRAQTEAASAIAAVNAMIDEAIEEVEEDEATECVNFPPPFSVN